MAEAIPVLDNDWAIAIKIRTSQDLFNFSSRSFMVKNSIPAQKLHPVEFFVKP